MNSTNTDNILLDWTMNLYGSLSHARMYNKADRKLWPQSKSSYGKTQTTEKIYPKQHADPNPSTSNRIQESY